MDLGFLDFYSPILGVHINILLLLLLGMLTGIITGMFSLGGGFIVIPMLSYYGVPMSIAVATSANQMIAGSLSAIIANIKHKTADFQLGGLLLSGGLLGTAIGFGVLSILRGLEYGQFILDMLFLFNICIVTFFALREIVLTIIFRKKPRPVVHTGNSSLPLQKTLKAFPHKISIIPLVLLGVLAGMLVVMLGIGGGFIVLPILIYVFHGQKNFVTSGIQMQIFVTSIISTFIHSYSLASTDVFLSAVMIIGAAIGGNIGTLFAKKSSDYHYKLILVIILLFMSSIMFYRTFSEPQDKFIVEISDNA